jgi:hypothetical protein
MIDHANAWKNPDNATWIPGKQPLDFDRVRPLEMRAITVASRMAAKATRLGCKVGSVRELGNRNKDNGARTQSDSSPSAHSMAHAPLPASRAVGWLRQTGMK